MPWTRSRVLKYPREIAPENVQEGDFVKAVYPVQRGILLTQTGTCGHRTDIGRRVQWTTPEGGHLFSWIPGFRHNPRITLLSRAEYPQETLSMFDAVNERME